MAVVIKVLIRCITSASSTVVLATLTFVALLSYMVVIMRFLFFLWDVSKCPFCYVCVLSRCLLLCRVFWSTTLRMSCSVTTCQCVDDHTCHNSCTNKYWQDVYSFPF
ncbi:hypothetical protein NP493_781g02010 [Ridgeia piscesae]|uniref:Uncharacterized protein n=1 Tax=Ridgeia piscesae TaxID=27915 RepID=A0AAD9KN91_RIDPI|nr:hypothetical protein NP493_781g02010 [Ridgeia piscesae]